MENEVGHGVPNWFVGPGEVDFLAWFTLGLLALAIYGVFYMYAMFDRWAETKSEGTPLAKTIPTLLTIALLYEVFPLDHMSVLLPLSAILIALMADWTRFRFGGHRDPVAPIAVPAVAPVDPAPTHDKQQ